MIWPVSVEKYSTLEIMTVCLGRSSRHQVTKTVSTPEAKMRPKSVNPAPSHVLSIRGFSPTLIKSIFHATRTLRDFLFPSHHKEDSLHWAGILFPTLHAIDRGPLHQAKIHTTLPQSIIWYLLHTDMRPLLLFVIIIEVFSYLTTLVPFRNTWISTA